MFQTLYGREEGGYIVRYEEPSMRVLMLEAEDIITLSNVGESSETEAGSASGGSSPAGGEW